MTQPIWLNGFVSFKAVRNKDTFNEFNVVMVQSEKRNKKLRQIFPDVFQTPRCMHTGAKPLLQIPKLVRVLNTMLNVSTMQELRLFGIRTPQQLVGMLMLGPVVRVQ